MIHITCNIYNSAGISRIGTYIALDALYVNGQETGFVDVKYREDETEQDEHDSNSCKLYVINEIIIKRKV